MKILEERIKKDGVVLEGEVLKVGSFLNHQIDPKLLKAMAEEWHESFKNEKVDKILTIEASGIAMASFAAYEFGVPLLFAKKSKTANIGDDVFSTDVKSYTHGTVNHVQVEKRFLNKGENVLIIDDFLARGEALKGLIDLCNQAGAHVVGCGVSIEKAFQPGGRELREKGYKVESLARIKSMNGQNSIEFC
ncbi:MAG: xanthine phosphoribosyltransferase [Lachnospiraceae bacterium]|nr:xanthine phosphoribosyltransferase [Candidatus Darwinimomas equi]